MMKIGIMNFIWVILVRGKFMLKWFYLLFDSCEHTYVFERSLHFEKFSGDYIIVTNRCTKCGRLSNHKIK